MDGVTVEFATGTSTAIMGPSGSGKSTLLQCVAGLDSPHGVHRVGAARRVHTADAIVAGATFRRTSGDRID